jgi:hypothetical protein
MDFPACDGPASRMTNKHSPDDGAIAGSPIRQYATTYPDLFMTPHVFNVHFVVSDVSIREEVSSRRKPQQ